jgi:hypothetical protein
MATTDVSSYGDVTAIVRGLVNDDAASSRLITDTQMDLWANTCLYEIAEHSEYREVVETDVTVSGTGIWSVEGDPLGIFRVEIDDEKIYPINSRELYRLSRTWQEQTGLPRWYRMDNMRNMESDDLRFELWPTPNAVYDIRIYSTVAADEVDSTTPNEFVMLPRWAVHGLAWGILSKFYESESRMQNLGAAQVYKVMYDQVIDRIKVRSYARLSRDESAWGAGRKNVVYSDLHQLMPADGFPTS